MPLQLQPFFKHIRPPNRTPSTNLIPPKPLNPLQTPPSSPPIDHLYISQLLSRSDWAVLLNHDLSSKTLLLNPSSAVSIFQNQQNPFHAIKFHSWLSHVNPRLAAHHSVHRALRNTLHRKGPALLSVELLRELRNLGFRVTEDLLCALVASWGRLGLANYSAHVFCQISFLGLSPTTRLYNALIDALVKSNSIDLAYLKFQQMAANNCVADRFTYNTLIHGVCKVGVVDEALRLVRQMKDKGHFPNVFTYTMLIDGFCIASRVDEAFGVFETMKVSGVYPNEATIRALVHGVFRCVDPSKALELLLSEFLDRKQEQERVHFKLACDTVLYCLANNSMAKEMVVFLRRVLGRGGYFPGNSIFNVIMACLVKGAELRETCEVFEILRKQGVKAGIGTYLALIEVLYKNEWIEDGDRVYGQLISDGLISNVFSYNMIINCFCRAKLMDNASEAFRDMQVRGFVPNLVTFNTLINGHCKDGAIDKARKLLESLLENGLKPDIFTFSSIVDGLCRIKRTEEALECFSEMIEWGINPNVVIYNILIRSLCTIGDVAMSVKLLRRMQKEGISPDTYSYNALIQIFCRMNKVEKAKKLFDSMSRSGLNPDNYTYSAFIVALSESGRLEEAKMMFYSMEANGCSPDSYICNLIIKILIQQDYVEEAQNIIERVQDPVKSIHFSNSNPTCHAFDQDSKDGHDLIIGLNTGNVYSVSLRQQLQDVGKKLVGAQHYNKDGSVNNSRCTCIAWVPGGDGAFVVAHADGNLYIYEKNKDIAGDSSFAVVKDQTQFSVSHARNSKSNPIARWHICQGSINSISFSTDGTYLATVGRDGYLRVFDYLKEQLIFGGKSYYGALLCCAWSMDGKYILTGGEDDLVQVWSMEDRKVVAWGEGHNSWVSGVAFDSYWSSPNSNDDEETVRYRFGSVGQDTQLLLWDLEMDEIVVPLRRPSGGSPTYSAGSQSSQWDSVVPLGTLQPAPSMLDVPKISPLVTHRVHTEPLSGLIFTQESVLTACREGHIKIWIRPAAAESQSSNSETLLSTSLKEKPSIFSKVSNSSHRQ